MGAISIFQHWKLPSLRISKTWYLYHIFLLPPHKLTFHLCFSLYCLKMAEFPPKLQLQKHELSPIYGCRYEIILWQLSFIDLDRFQALCHFSTTVKNLSKNCASMHTLWSLFFWHKNQPCDSRTGITICVGISLACTILRLDSGTGTFLKLDRGSSTSLGLSRNGVGMVGVDWQIVNWVAIDWL